MFLEIWLGDDTAGDTSVVAKEDDAPVDDEGDVFWG
jgi:hypothetical protein